MAAGDPSVTINIFANSAKAQAGLDNVSRKVKGVGTAAAATSGSTGRLVGQFNKLTTAVGGIGAVLLVFGTMRKAIRDLVKVNLEFEESMQKVRAVTEQASTFTVSAFKDMQDEARRLGAITRFSAADAAQGLVFLGMAGFTAEEATKALASTLRLAQAGGLEMGRAADIVTNVLTAFGKKADETERFVDVFAATAASSNTNVEQLAQGMKFAAPIAGGLGHKVEDTAAALGTLASSGIQATMGGTALRMMLVKLADPTSKAVRKLKEMGFTYDQINPKTNSLHDILVRLRDAGVGVSEAFALFGARGGVGAALLVSQIARFEEMQSVTHGAAGAATQMAETMDNTVQGALLRVRSAWQELLIAIGDSGLKDDLRDIVENTALWLQEINRVGSVADTLGKDFGHLLRVIGDITHGIKNMDDLWREISGLPNIEVPGWVKMAGGGPVATMKNAFGTLIDSMYLIEDSGKDIDKVLSDVGDTIDRMSKGVGDIKTFDEQQRRLSILGKEIERLTTKKDGASPAMLKTIDEALVRYGKLVTVIASVNDLDVAKSKKDKKELEDQMKRAGVDLTDEAGMVAFQKRMEEAEEAMADLAKQQAKQELQGLTSDEEIAKRLGRNGVESVVALYREMEKITTALDKAPEMVSEQDVERLKTLTELEGKIFDLQAKKKAAEEKEASVRLEINSELEEEMGILSAKLAGQKDLVTQLEAEAAIRAKTQDLEKSGISGAEEKARKLIEAQNAVKAKEEADAKAKKAAAATTSGPSVVADDLQARGGGGSFYEFGSSLTDPTQKTADATQKTADNTAALLTAVQGGSPNIGGTSDSQGQVLAVLGNIHEVLRTMLDKGVSLPILRVSTV